MGFTSYEEPQGLWKVYWATKGGEEKTKVEKGGMLFGKLKLENWRIEMA
jgi:hypothetical protein